MINLVDFIDGGLLDAIALTLVHFLWQGLALGAVAWLILRVALRSASAKTRHAFCVGNLLLLAACPVVTFASLERPPASLTMTNVTVEETLLLEESSDLSSGAALAFELSERETPSVEFESAPKQSVPDVEPIETVSTSLAAEPSTETLGSPETPGSSETLAATESAVQTFEEAAVPAVSPAEAELPPARSAWTGLAPYVCAAYLIGVALMLARLALALQGGRRLRRDSTPVEDSALLAVVGERAAAMGLAFTPAVAYCARIAVPTVVGVLRPMILLPASINTGLSISQLELLLSHELAHIRRHDHLINMLQRCIEALLFFHPAVWFISRQISIERENCCDDLVLRSGGEAHAYAESLVNAAAMGKGRTLPSPATLGATDKPSQLRNRINRMFGGPTPKLGLTRVGVIASLLAGTLAVVALYEVARYRRAPLLVPPEETAGELPFQFTEEEQKLVEMAFETWEVKTELARSRALLSPDGDPLEGEAAELARQLTEETDWWLRQVAAQKMGESGDSNFVPYLINAVADVDERVVIAAVDSLGVIGDPAAIGHLMGVTRYDGAPAQRAALALSKIDDPRVQEYVNLALDDTSSDVRKGAYRVLGALDTDEGVNTLVTRGLAEGFLFAPWGSKRDDFRVKVDLLAHPPKMLVDLPPERYMDILMSELKKNKESIAKGAAIVGSYIGGDDGLRILRTLADVSDFEVRRGVILSLGEFEVPAATEQLVSMMHDDDFSTVQEAARSLEKKGYSPENLKDSAAYFVGLGNWEVAATFGEAVIAPLAKVLTSDSKKDRKKAAAALGILGDPRAIGPLSQLLNDTDSAVRGAVVESLRTIGGPDAVMPTTRALRDPRDDIRVAAAESLGQFRDSRAIPALSASLKDMDRGVRFRAIEALRNIGGPEAVDALIESLSSNLEGLAQSSAHYLGALGDTRAVEPLAVLFAQGGDPNDSGARRQVRDTAALSLAQLGDPRPIEFLRLNAKGNILNHYLERLAAIQTEAAYSAMIDIVTRNQGSDGRSVRYVVDLLSEDASPKAVDAVIKIALDASLPIESRSYAIAALGRIGDTRAITPLRNLYQSNSAPADLVEVALTVIKHLKGDDSETEMPQKSETIVTQRPPKTSANTDAPPDPVTTVTEAAQPVSQPAGTSEEIGAASQGFNSKAIELIGQLQDGDWWLRKIAVQQLPDLIEGFGGEERTDLVRYLIQSLNDEDPRVRQATAEALGEIADPMAIKHLVAAMKDEQVAVVDAAANALAAFGSPEVVQYLRLALDEPSREMNAAAVYALAARKREGTLSALVHATDGAARSEAIEALKDYDAAEVEAEMLQGFAENNFNEKRSVAISLGRLGNARGRELLAELAEESEGEERVVVAISLIEFGDPQAAAILIQSLSDTSMDARKRAAEKLRQINHLPESRANQAKYFVAIEDWGHVGGLGADALEPLIHYLYAAGLKVVYRDRIGRDLLESAISITAELKDPAAIPALARMLTHEVSRIRAQTSGALQAIGDAAALPALKTALSDVDANVRTQALEAIVAIGGVDALESLVKATQDVNEQLRSTAAAHLGVLGPDALEVIMEVYPRFTERATVIGAAIAEMGPQAIDFLIAELNSGDAAAESTAAFALSKFEEPRSVEALSQMALNILAEDNIRSTATYHLGNMAHETARASLWMILSSSAGKVAAYSLGRDMDFADCERMEKWLEDNPDVGFGVRSRIRRVVEDFRRRYPGAQAR